MIRLDKVKATAHLVNFTFAASDLANGSIVELGDLQADGETYAGVAPTAVTNKGLVIHASVPMDYENASLEVDYVLPKGKEGRGYVPEKGDIITITNDLVEGTTAPKKGDILEPTADKTTWSINATPTGSIQARFLAAEKIGGEAATVLEIL